jgi:hypothetical protein
MPVIDLESAACEVVRLLDGARGALRCRDAGEGHLCRGRSKRRHEFRATRFTQPAVSAGASANVTSIRAST